MNVNKEPASKKNKNIISMKNNSSKIEKNDIISVESKIMTRTTRYRINEKIAIDKKIKACNNQPIQIKMEKGNNLRVYCRAVAFERVRGIIEKILGTNYTINQAKTKDKTDKIVSEVLRVAQKESRRNEAIFTINIFRTKSSFLINGPHVQQFLPELFPVLQSWATENTVDIKDEKLKNVLSKMRIVQTPIIKSKQKQETTPEIQKQKTEGEELDFVIHTGNNEERQKVEEGNSTQVLPAQINELEINGNSNTKDLINKQADNNKTEDIAIENMHHNKKPSNESKTTTRTESKTDKKEESNYKETTSKNEIGKGKDRQRTARRNKIYREWGKNPFKTVHIRKLKKVQEKI